MEEKDYKLFKNLGYNISHVDDDHIEFYKDPYDILRLDKRHKTIVKCGKPMPYKVININDFDKFLAISRWLHEYKFAEKCKKNNKYTIA